MRWNGFGVWEHPKGFSARFVGIEAVSQSGAALGSEVCVAL
ncbi:hypothetical protein HDF08_002846 [Edaphobacter lichenicola]|uniref:Uncharacterized protein n=1 Tax=Tunturiibacter lichenicola TaxID=2051959 RepID=A0A852VJX9_9BACT|nr:hypothetical protein [Edaphobacter lichenicola]